MSRRYLGATTCPASVAPAVRRSNLNVRITRSLAVPRRVAGQDLRRQKSAFRCVCRAILQHLVLRDGETEARGLPADRVMPVAMEATLTMRPPSRTLGARASSHTSLHLLRSSSEDF